MISINTVPTCFHHPVKVVFLDDNRQFLDALYLEFHPHINMLMFTDPDLLLQLIENDSQDMTQSIFKFVDDVNSDSISGRIINFNVSNIINLLYDKRRFNNIAVLIVDYGMPDINGIEFCQNLKDKKVFKIMLTAEADSNIAIKAFNDGLINKFILKTTEHLHQEIILAVNELTHNYFKELSPNLVNRHDGHSHDLFEKTVFKELFTKVISQSQAVEYYRVDNSGSFLFLDKDANPTWLLVKHNNALDEQLEMLQGYEVPEPIMASLYKKEKILFLLSEKEYEKPIEAWMKQIVDSKRLDDNYHYSIVNGQLTDSIAWHNVASYSAYIAELNCVQ